VMEQAGRTSSGMSTDTLALGICPPDIVSGRLAKKSAKLVAGVGDDMARADRVKAQFLSGFVIPPDVDGHIFSQ
jgi:hypothetical protein